jgi:hypothetical protein
MTSIIYSKFKDVQNETTELVKSLPLCGITIGTVTEGSNWYFQELATSAIVELSTCASNFAHHFQIPGPEIERLVRKVNVLHEFVHGKTVHKIDPVLNDAIIAAEMAEHLWFCIGNRTSGDYARNEDGTPNIELTLQEKGIRTETIYQFYKIAIFISNIVKERERDSKRKKL